MLTLSAITRLFVIRIIGAILLVVAVWLILEMTLKAPGNNSVMDRIRKR